MRHDPAGASIVIMLRSLKLHGMAQAVDDLVAQGAPAFEAATPMIGVEGFVKTLWPYLYTPVRNHGQLQFFVQA